MADKTVDQSVVEVVFCMGSSCFSRGVNKALKMLQAYLKERGLEGRVSIQGTLCQGQCQQGPNITINGKGYRATDPGVVLDLVKHHLENFNSKD